MKIERYRNHEIIKGAGATMWMVRDPEGDVMRFYKKRECVAWIDRMEAAKAEIEAERRERIAARAAARPARIERARAYLAERAARPVQLKLF